MIETHHVLAYISLPCQWVTLQHTHSERGQDAIAGHIVDCNTPCSCVHFTPLSIAMGHYAANALERGQDAIAGHIVDSYATHSCVYFTHLAL